jgi:hypothetical protein
METEMEITVRVKNVYGKQLVYPVNDNAQLLCALTGAKTFTSEALAVIKQLGYTVTVETPTI